MARFEHQRHRQPRALAEPRPLIVACPQLQSHVNLSRIVRVASCIGIERVIACGNASLDRRIARDGADRIRLDVRRTLAAPLTKLREEGFRLVGLEQATGSQSLFEYRFAKRSVLVLGHERQGLVADLLALLDDVVEIPVYGLPFSYNVASAAAMAMYEYCRQFPDG
jgi:tRNA G18 (ribose-2'-O)-methylase SpoU